IPVPEARGHGCVPRPLRRAIAYIGRIPCRREPHGLARVSDCQCHWWHHLGRGVRPRRLLFRSISASTSPRARACRICTRAGFLLWMWLLDPALRESAYSTSRTRVTRTTCGRRRCEGTLMHSGLDRYRDGRLEGRQRQWRTQPPRVRVTCGGNQCARIRSALPQSSDVRGACWHFAFVPTADSCTATTKVDRLQ